MPTRNRYNGRITANIYADSAEEAEEIFSDAFPSVYSSDIEVVEADVAFEEKLVKEGEDQ